MSLEQVINKRASIVSELPKLSSLIEKSDKFNVFFRKLCSVKNAEVNVKDGLAIKNLRLPK